MQVPQHPWLRADGHSFFHFIQRILKARTLLELMEKREMKEAEMLKQRIALIEHLAAVMFNSLKAMQRPELVVHMSAIAHAGIKLPFDIRLSLLQRKADDLMVDLKDCGKKTAAQEISASLTKTLKLWETDGRDGAEDELSAGQIWEAEVTRIQMRAEAGEIADEEVAEEKASSAEACCCYCYCPVGVAMSACVCVCAIQSIRKLDFLTVDCRPKSISKQVVI